MVDTAIIACPLCGNQFDKNAELCHVSCPMAEGCRIICCPNCGYQTVDESKSTTLTFVRGLWQRWRRDNPENKA